MYGNDKMESNNEFTLIIDYLNFKNIKWMPIMIEIDPKTNKKNYLPVQNKSVLGYKINCNDFNNITDEELKKRQALLHLSDFIEIDTNVIQQLDIDDPGFDANEFKEIYPYFESITKKLPHFFCYLKNKKNHPKTCYNLNSNPNIELLTGRWSLCRKDTKVYNHEYPVSLFTDEEIIKEEKEILFLDKCKVKCNDKIIDNISEKYATEYNSWFGIGAAMYNNGFTFEEFDRFSGKSKKDYPNGNGVKKLWESFKVHPLKNYTIGTIKYFSRLSDPDEYKKLITKQECEEINQNCEGGKILEMSEIRELIDKKFETTQEYPEVVAYSNALFNTVLTTVEKGKGEIILKKRYEDGEFVYERFNITTFITIFSYFSYNLKIPDKEGEFKPVIPTPNLVKIFYNSKIVKRYKDVMFYPGVKSNCNDRLNIFTGLERKQTKIYNKEQLKQLEENELKPFIDHIRLNLCDDEEIVFNYTLKWLGCTVKHPEIKLKTCVVLNGKPGAGKGAIVDKIGECLGNKFVSRPQSMESIAGSFGLGSLSESLIVFLDEAFWGGDKKLKGAIKKLITEKNVTVEKKYLNSYNTEIFFNVILASNEDKVVNIDLDQRRFIVLNVKKMEDKQYYKDIVATDPQMLYDYFCSKDYTGFEWDEIPTTRYTQEQQEHSLDSVSCFIQEYFLQESKTELISKTELYEEYKRSTKFPEKVKSFWRLMKKYLPESIDYSDFRIKKEDFDGKITRPKAIKISTDMKILIEDYKKSTGLTLLEF
jgi:hypothetical protein